MSLEELELLLEEELEDELDEELLEDAEEDRPLLFFLLFFYFFSFVSGGPFWLRAAAPMGKDRADYKLMPGASRRFYFFSSSMGFG